MTDLILWRHADAEDGAPDMARRLTAKGRRQARIIAKWLKPRLPKQVKIVVSPALRARETADALELDYEIAEALAPGASAAQVLQAMKWPEESGDILVVGHQPTFGRVAALVVSGQESEWTIKKAGVFWIARRGTVAEAENAIRLVISPDVLDE